MAGWNGTGTYERFHDWTADEAAGTDIEASRMDEEDDTIAGGINACLTKNGENTPSTNLPMNNNKHTGVAASAARTDYVRVAELADGVHTWEATDGGAADAYSITPAPAIAAYAAGQRFQFIPANDNTGASTLTVSGLATKSIKLVNGADPYAKAIDTSMVADVIYDGTNFVLLNPAWFSTALAGQVTATAAQINTAATKADWYTNTWTTAAAATTTTSTFAHGLGTDELDLNLMLDFTGLAGTEEPNLIAYLINAAGEAVSVGRSVAGTFTNADIPAAGNLALKVTLGVATATTFRLTARKRA